MIFLINFFVKIIIVTKMFKLRNDSDKHHGVIDTLLEFTLR